MDRMDALERKDDEAGMLCEHLPAIQFIGLFSFDMNVNCHRFSLQTWTLFFFFVHAETSRLNDTTIEERVAILEFQVEILNTEVVDQAEDLDRIEGDITILSADQVQQNERLLELEIDSDGKYARQCNTTIFTDTW